MATIVITGYEQDGRCEHCGRPLRHCIRVDDGRIVGATCFNKLLTKPLQYNGKPYRVGEENIIRRAKAVELGKLARAGFTARDLVFEAV